MRKSGADPAELLASGQRVSLDHPKEVALGLALARFPEAVGETLVDLTPNRWGGMCTEEGRGGCMEARAQRALQAFGGPGRTRAREPRHSHLAAPHPTPPPPPTPHRPRLTDYLYSLSEAFNQFYQECKVVGSEQEASRLLLCEATARVIRKCFQLLGITPLYRI